MLPTYSSSSRALGWWRTLLLGLTLAFLVVGLRGAGTGTSVPVASAQASTKTFVGVWVVQIDPTDAGARRLISVAPGGLLDADEAPTRPFAPGEGPPGVPREYDSQGYGIWESRGGQDYAFKFLEGSYDDAGNTLGLTTIAGTVTLDASGDAFSGTYTVTVTTADGTLIPAVPSTPLIGTRVTFSSAP